MSKMLSSWKEIAHFFGKGVRTVQRWEKTLDLPIRRPPGAPSNVVLARTSDLEEWMHRSVAAREAAAPDTSDTGALDRAISELETEVHLLTHRQPHPVEAKTNDATESAERLHRMIEIIRTLRHESDHNTLKRVA